MEQRRIRKNAIEMTRRQIEGEKILLPNVAPTVGTGHRHKFFGPIQSDGAMPKTREGCEIPTRAAAKIQNAPGLRQQDSV